MTTPQPRSELTGWTRFFHLKLRFGLSKLPFFPVRYRLRTPGFPDVFFYWTHVIPFMDPIRGAFDFELYGWDVRELRFLRRFLRPGMTFFDLGAHDGLYSILAARCLGGSGSVRAFEPAPGPGRRLGWHRRMNRAAGLEIHRAAVGASQGPGDLYVPVRGIDTIGSLRAPGVGDGSTRKLTVEMVTLDGFMASHPVRPPDLIKLDVEGAETAVLEGSVVLLERHQPIWLFEALDATSAAWGTSGRALVERFIALGHVIFEFEADGRLRPHAVRAHYPLDSNCNLLAVPPGRLPGIATLITGPGQDAPHA